MIKIIPGVNPRQLKQMMRQMGMSQEDLDVTQVIIRTHKKNYIFDNPTVQKVIMQGQESFQVSGDYKTEELNFIAQVSDDDIKMVSEQAGVSIEEARKALDETNGDIAQAIINLSTNN